MLTSSVRLVLAFRRLRPLFYEGRQSCLLDSLVLASFLAKYRRLSAAWSSA